MEIRGNDTNFRPSDPARPERVDRPAAPLRDGDQLANPRRRLVANGDKSPEVVTDELSKRQLRQLRLAKIAADKRAEGAGNAERPVPGGGVDSIQVSSDAERLAKVEETVRKFEVPSRAARIAELRQSFEKGDLNSAELIQLAAQQMLEGRSKLG